MTDLYAPKKSDKFTFGLWTVGNTGRDPFGAPVREPLDPKEIVAKLSSLGAFGVNLHDNDLVPIDATPKERDKIVKEFKKALAEHDMRVPMATTNLFSDPIFKDGAFTSSNPSVRAYAVQKAMGGMDLGAELGAKVYVFWGGREGTETDACRDPRDAAKWFREALNFLCEYSIKQNYGYKFALEAKPNEPRGDIYLATTGAMLGFIATLDHPDMVGVNPEVAHEVMAGLNFAHQVGQALEAGKLFHIDLNAQKIGRYDQDLRFGSEDVKGAFFLVKLLEDAGYQGSRHFDCHPYRSEDASGVWDFAAGCMRTYLILKEKVRRFREDPEIQGLLSEIRVQNESSGPGAPDWKTLLKAYSTKSATALKGHKFNRKSISDKGLHYERLDQLVMDLLLGVR